MGEKPNYKTTFRCDSCKRIIKKEETVFTTTSYGAKVWLCRNCAILNGISIDNIGTEE